VLSRFHLVACLWTSEQKQQVVYQLTCIWVSESSCLLEGDWNLLYESLIVENKLLPLLNSPSQTRRAPIFVFFKGLYVFSKLYFVTDNAIECRQPHIFSLANKKLKRFGVQRIVFIFLHCFPHKLQKRIPLLFCFWIPRISLMVALPYGNSSVKNSAVFCPFFNYHWLKIIETQTDCSKHDSDYYKC